MPDMPADDDEYREFLRHAKAEVDAFVNAQRQPGDKYIVQVDDNFHHMDESERYTLGEYDSEAEAIQAATDLIDRFLTEALTPQSTPESLFSTYTQFGEDPFISGSAFNAWEYARQRCKELCAPGV